MKLGLILTLFLISHLACASSIDNLKTANAIKAIYESGLQLPHILEVRFVREQNPPKYLYLLIFTERSVDRNCPSGINEKGYAVRFKENTNLIDLILPLQSRDCELR